MLQYVYHNLTPNRPFLCFRVCLHLTYIFLIFCAQWETNVNTSLQELNLLLFFCFFFLPLLSWDVFHEPLLKFDQRVKVRLGPRCTKAVGKSQQCFVGLKRECPQGWTLYDHACWMAALVWWSGRLWLKPHTGAIRLGRCCWFHFLLAAPVKCLHFALAS